MTDIYMCFFFFSTTYDTGMLALPMV